MGETETARGLAVYCTVLLKIISNANGVYIEKKCFAVFFFFFTKRKSNITFRFERKWAFFLFNNNHNHKKRQVVLHFNK